MVSNSSTNGFEIRCACGKRHRFENVRPGFRATCPECGSLLEVTAADLETVFADDGSIQFHEEHEQPQEAILVNPEPVRLAAKGSRQGLTGDITYTNEDALLQTALSGRAPRTFADSPAALVAGEAAPRPRTFVEDMLASFWFAGNRNNAINLLLTALPAALLTMAGAVIPFPLSLFLSIGWLIVFAYIVQFYWFVLRTSARGEDEIPWFETDWNVYEDVIWPLVWIGYITFMCSLPALWVYWYMPDGPGKTPLALILLAAGFFLWPVAVMSVAMGNSFWFIRPDWLVRCIAAIGSSYVITWLLILAAMVPWVLLMANGLGFLVSSAGWVARLVFVLVTALPVACLNLYFGYVAFRILGLMYRHFHSRFPWG